MKPDDAVSDEVERRRSPNDALAVIESVAELVLHDIRNIILPLTVQVDLAMEAAQDDPAARDALSEVQDSCQRCGERLERLETVTDPDWNPSGDLDVHDLFERMRLILRYALPDSVAIDIDAPPNLPLIDAALDRLQGAIFAIATAPIAHAPTHLGLTAAADDDGFLISLEIETERPVPPSTFDDVAAGDEPGERREIECDGTTVRVLTWWPIRRTRSSADGHHEGRRVLLLHRDALRRGLIRSHLTQNGLIVSTDPHSDEIEVAVMDDAGAASEREHLPRVILGADADESTEHTACIAAPYSLDDILNAVIALIPRGPRDPEESTP